jgi:hypothetical protein
LQRAIATRAKTTIIARADPKSQPFAQFLSKARQRAPAASMYTDFQIKALR